MDFRLELCLCYAKSMFIEYFWLKWKLAIFIFFVFSKLKKFFSHFYKFCNKKFKLFNKFINKSFIWKFFGKIFSRSHQTWIDWPNKLFSSLRQRIRSDLKRDPVNFEFASWIAGLRQIAKRINSKIEFGTRADPESAGWLDGTFPRELNCGVDILKYLIRYSKILYLGVDILKFSKLD